MGLRYPGMGFTGCGYGGKVARYGKRSGFGFRSLFMGVKEGPRLWDALPCVGAFQWALRQNSGNHLWETAWVASYGGFSGEKERRPWIRFCISRMNPCMRKGCLDEGNRLWDRLRVT